MKKTTNLRNILLEKKALEVAEDVVRNCYWDKVAENLLKTGYYSVGKVDIQGIDRRDVNFRDELVLQRGKKALFNSIKQDFQNKNVGFFVLLRKLASIGNSKSVEDVKVLLTKMALRKVTGIDSKGLRDEEIKKALGECGNVRFTVKELGDVLRYARVSYGSRDIVVQFLEAYLGDLAKGIIEMYLEGLE